MASRLYLSSTTVAPISPAFAAGWTNTTLSDRRLLRRVLPPAGGEASVSINRSHTLGQVRLDRQFVSPPLKAQTINGTFSGQVQCREGVATQNVFMRMTMRVVSADGTVVRGTLLALADYGVPTELTTTSRNHVIAVVGTALTPVVCLEGDRIVFELGYTDVAGAGSPQAITLYQAVAGALDYVAGNETDTVVKNPWIEFSLDLIWQPYFVALNRTLEAGFLTDEVYTPVVYPVALNRTLEAGFLADLTGPYVTAEAPVGLPCSDPTDTEVTFEIRAITPRTVNLASVVVTIQLGFAAPVTVYTGSAFQSGFSGLVASTSTGSEDVRTFTFSRNAGLPSDTIIGITVAGADDLGTVIGPTTSWTFLTCPPPPLQVAANPAAVPYDGGWPVTLTNVDDGIYRVYLGPNGDNTDPQCISDEEGARDEILIEGETVVVYTPPFAAAATGYRYFLEKVSGPNRSTLSSAATITILPIHFRSKLLALRRTLPPPYWVGYRRPEDV